MDFGYLDDWIEDETVAPEIVEAGEGYRHILVIAEQEGGSLSRSSLEAMGQARDLADQIGVYVFAVLAGEGVEELGEESVAFGADRVLIVSEPEVVARGYQPEVYVELLAELVRQHRPEILLLPASPLGNDLAPRLAQRLDTGLISHCIKLDMDMSERVLLGTVGVLGGEVYHTFACPEARPQIATLQPGYFTTPHPDAHRSGSVEVVALDSGLGGQLPSLRWIDFDVEVNLPPISLDRAPTVVTAGRGVSDDDGFALVEKLAERLGGQLAGSRGAFDEGWIDEDRIVGIGGESISPDLYLACGVSGDIHHYAGIRDAKFVVAINPDENAPIVSIANIAIVADARQVIPAMLEVLGD